MRRPSITKRRPRPEAPREAAGAAAVKPPQRSQRIPSSFYTPPEYTPEELADVMAGTRLRVPVAFVPGFEVHVRPLGEAEIDDARLEARARAQLALTQAGIGDSKGAFVDELRERALERAVVLRATMRPAGPLSEPAPFFASIVEVEALDSSTLSTLFDTFVQAQERARPAHDDVEVKHLVESLARHRNGLESVRARYAAELCAFYGVRSTVQLTSWQVIHFAQLLEAPR